MVKTLYLLISTIIGLAGVPGDLVLWGRTMTPFLEWLDSSWLARAFLVLSGFVVFTYSRWKPHVVTVWRKLDSLLKSDDLNNRLEVLQRDLAIVQDDRHKYIQELAKERSKYEAAQVALKTAEGENGYYKQYFEGYDKKMSDLQLKYNKLNWIHGRNIILNKGRESGKSRDLSISAQFIAIEDAKLCVKIRDLFWSGQGLYHIMQNQPQIPWFRNPSGSRIVLFSDCLLTREIEFTINTLDLLGERVSYLSKDSAQVNLPNVSIAIVVFPKDK